MLLDLWPLLDQNPVTPPPPVVGGSGGGYRPSVVPYVPPRKRIRIRRGPARVEAADVLRVRYEVAGAGQVDGVGAISVSHTASATVHVRGKGISQEFGTVRIGSAGLIDSKDLELLLAAAVLLDEESM